MLDEVVDVDPPLLATLMVTCNQGTECATPVGSFRGIAEQLSSTPLTRFPPRVISMLVGFGRGNADIGLHTSYTDP